MITASNYNTQITKVNFSELPPVMQKMHDQLIVEKNGLNYYGKNDDITRVIDTYLKKLNEVVPSGTEKIAIANARSEGRTGSGKFDIIDQKGIGTNAHRFDSYEAAEAHVQNQRNRFPDAEFSIIDSVTKNVYRTFLPKRKSKPNPKKKYFTSR